jgi:hypothetical protein
MDAVETMMLVGFGVEWESRHKKKSQIVITKLWNSNHKLTKAPKKKRGRGNKEQNWRTHVQEDKWTI